jgi:carboxylesterase
MHLKKITHLPLVSTQLTVVLFHGLCSSPLELAYLANSLRQAGYLVETPLLQGYTYGTGKNKWQAWMEEAKEVVSKLQASSQGGVVLGGLSMGATLALGLCAQLDNIAGMVALSTTIQYDGWAVPWYRFLLPYAEKIGCGRFYEFTESEPYGVKNEQLRSMVKKALENNKVSEVGGASFTLNHLAEADKLCKFVKNNLHLINADLLVVHAVDDEVASVRNADLVMANVSSLEKEAIFLGNSYHIITVDNERETVSTEVEYFLRQIKNRIQGENKNPLFPVVSPELARYLRRHR